MHPPAYEGSKCDESQEERYNKQPSQLKLPSTDDVYHQQIYLEPFLHFLVEVLLTLSHILRGKKNSYYGIALLPKYGNSNTQPKAQDNPQITTP
tara:strand:+ start:128 stop:409 length:282 start_codon:yes stop_codon:yes gene_type:complete